MTNNPLLESFQTLYETAPFELIENKHFLPAIIEGIAAGRNEVALIAESEAVPTFINTVVALERMGDQLGRATSILFNLNAAETNPELQQIVKEAAPMLTEYGNDITLNTRLFARIKSVYDGREELQLDVES